MNDFYNIIRNSCQKDDLIIATILSEKDFGQRAVFTAASMIFESSPGVFSKELIGEMRGNKQDGIQVVGDCRIFREKLGNEKKMIICGGGHVSIPIIKIAALVGFKVTVIEDRILFADHARRAGADEVICDDFGRALAKIDGGPDTYFVIVTRGHRYDEECLDEILARPNAYIGMIGSRARVARVRETMIAKGHRAEKVNAIYSPIGLRIGAETPEEIAVSIMAEIIQVKNKEKRVQGYTEEILDAVLGMSAEEMPKMLATIVSRKGSAPRAAGTKMVIFRDGRTVGTIGGGCAEADICRKAQMQMAGEDRSPKLYNVDMTGTDAENDGMVCGGVIEVLLESV